MERLISETLIQIILTEPFFGHLAGTLLRESRDDIPETALLLYADGKIALGINPEFWSQSSLSMPQQIGAIKHELLHLVLLHPFRKDEFPDAKLFGIATDLVVNQYLSPEQLRTTQISLDQFLDQPWEANRGVAYYYRQLLALQAQTIPSTKADQELLAQWQQADHAALGGHQHWVESLESLTPEQQEAIGSIWQHRLRKLLQQAAGSSFYRLSEPLRALIDRRLKGRKTDLDWRRVLRMFASNSRKMVLKDTIRRPSKRYGTVPGIKIKRRQKLMIALDTSGSLQVDLLGDFFREIYQLWRCGAELSIVECDDQIRKQYPYHGQVVTEVAGRGGTLFDEPIRLANESRMDGLIYLTDGFGPVPKVQPRLPMLWMVSKNGLRTDTRAWQLLPGKAVKMK
ncbi:MAG: hypothetical protein KTR30_31630 [Saprospiraceae bacterium]|nr:hypothetical protein [Saprospiraceae bacterium]